MARKWKIEVRRGRGKQPYRFRIRAANGEIVTPEGHPTHGNAMRAAKRFKEGVASAEIVEV